MLRGLNNLFRGEHDLKYQFTVSIHSLALASNMPWHSDKVWYHENAKECINLPSSCKELMLVWKCGTKLAATGSVEVDPESADQVVWGHELGMVCSLSRLPSIGSDPKRPFRPKKAKFKLLWRGLPKPDAVGAIAGGGPSDEPRRLGPWLPLASGYLDLAQLSAVGDRRETAPKLFQQCSVLGCDGMFVWSTL